VRPQLLDTLVLVKPATVIAWRRKGFRIHSRWRSRRSGRSKTNAEIRALIHRMSSANSFWGAPRIHGELLKLGVDVSQATDHHEARTHLSLNKDCPQPRPVQPPSAGKIVAIPEVGRLHHRYQRRAA